MVEIGEGAGGLPCVTLAAEASTATVYLHGAHLTDVCWRGERPLLFLSARSRFAPGQAIRGGIPVIFPWFGNREGFPAHGFARTADWALAETRVRPDGGVEATLSLADAPAAIEWPSFAVRYTIGIGSRLDLRLEIENRDPSRVMKVEHCLHTYLSVGDIDQTWISGLHGSHFVDKVDGFSTKVDDAATLRLSGETDRVYCGAPQPVTIEDHALGRRIRIEKSGARSTVVWNPWAEKSKSMADLAPDDYRRVLCVESGSVGADVLLLAPGERHESRVTIDRRPL
jgi:D-hexose-6-phosphate mutarotase